MDEVTAETLTDEQILAWQRSMVSSLTASSREVDEACRNAEYAMGGRNCDLPRRIVAEAREHIAAAINARAKRGDRD